MPETYSISITRANEWDESYNVYAALGHHPIESGDGILVGNVTIAPNASTATTTWTPSVNGEWLFAAEAVRWGLTGPLGRLT